MWENNILLGTCDLKEEKKTTTNYNITQQKDAHSNNQKNKRE